MPIYSYQCPNGHEFELRQSFSAEPRQECPDCSEMAQRQIHAVGVIYKGSGFYTTDYARKSNGKSEDSSDKSESSKTEKSESSKSGEPKKESSGSDSAAPKSESSSGKSESSSSTSSASSSSDTK